MIFQIGQSQAPSPALGQLFVIEDNYSMPSLALPPSPGSSAPIPLGINLPFLLCPYSQREIFIAIPLEPGHAGGHMTQEQHLKVFLGFTQVAVKREKKPSHLCRRRHKTIFCRKERGQTEGQNTGQDSLGSAGVPVSESHELPTPPPCLQFFVFVNQ